jgi:putative Holliday junction resolvase
MAIDYGLTKIGLALTDQLRIIAQPFGTIQNISLKRSSCEVVEIAKEYHVITIVIGLPLSMNGSDNIMTNIVYKFKNTILLLTDIKVVTFDERLTTYQTKRILRELGIRNKKKKYRLLEDQISATLILQTYLESIT